MKQIAKKYARALVEVAGAHAQEERSLVDGLEAIKELFAVEHARRILFSPVMPVRLKSDLLTYALDNSGNNKLLRVFVEVMLTAKRVELLPDIADCYHQLRADAAGTQTGVLISAVAMDAGVLAELAGDLTQIFKQQVSLENRVDKTLLGGYVVRVGNTLIDQSVTSKIKALAQGLQQAAD